MAIFKVIIQAWLYLNTNKKEFRKLVNLVTSNLHQITEGEQANRLVE